MFALSAARRISCRIGWQDVAQMCTTGVIVNPPLNYNPEVQPGMEKWHEKSSIPGSLTKFKWPSYNQLVFKADGTYRPAYVCHMRGPMKYSQDKMFYVASMVRGLTVDEALKQLSFVNMKGAVIAHQVISEARQMALDEHNFEFATNMWVAESFCTPHKIYHGIRRHARMRMGKIRYRYSCYFVRLEEGKPPKHYYDHRQDHWNPHQWLEHYLQEHRSKTVPFY